MEPDNFPSQPVAPQQTASAAAATVAAQAAANFQLATRAYNLDQLDIADPSLEPEGVAGTAPEASPPPAGAPSDFPQDLLSSAAQLGIGAEEAKSFGSPEALRRTIDVARRVSPRPAQPARQPAPAAVVEPEPQVELPSLRDYVYPAGATDESGRSVAGQTIFDDRLIEVLEARDEAIRNIVAENAALKKQVGAVHQTAQQAAQAQVYAAYDNAFAGVPEEYKGAVGLGSYDTMSDQSPEYQTRVEVYALAEETRKVRQALGRPISFKDAFDRALRAVCAPQAQQATQQKVAAKRDAATGQYIARPTQSKNGSAAAAPSPADFDRQNIARLAQRMREMGMN